LTGTGSRLGAELGARLAAEHAVTVVDREAPSFEVDGFRQTDDFDQAVLEEVVQGADVIIDALLHDVRPLRELDLEQSALDLGGRVTCNLLWAADHQGVERFVLASSLEPFADYDQDLILTEQFRPLPTTAADQLACHVAEAACREASRETEIRVSVVRLGRLVLEEEVAGQPFDRLWVDVRDTAEALALIATWTPQEDGQRRRGRRWLATAHICADRPDAIASVGGLRRWLGYEPEHRFGYLPPEPAEEAAAS
jgi:nucleoside-diphosphate-sugar epimerase